MKTIQLLVEVVNMLEKLSWQALLKLAILLAILALFLFVLNQMGLTKITIGIGE